MKNNLRNILSFIVIVILIGNLYFIYNLKSYIVSLDLKEVKNKVENLEKENKQLYETVVSLESYINPNNKTYDDGEYVGEAKGYKSNIKVSVSVKDNKISDVKVISHDDTPSFTDKTIEVIPKEIVNKQSTDIDVVSGATLTSKGILDAVNNALK
ncbi:FMN-binding domain-containing protein [Gottschalkia acidurici 9a]|uniref:FMN-binding domain-containing protein n=1 Tax=Gottschalkia acidurici (strain ATCC 7906 / DSM 604 / BCRC 14475 / CIP 104303 / KCTC 5404 / NCIMB 10678 / 9a) TaxID=1128398 RepID=K0AY28_GOTA9|nr:FMN-binding protein [Gottschalkia acidurici]AFS78129.1 FMN-binding domain-containing protein [Gottschalkia acidurici 9a]